MIEHRKLDNQERLKLLLLDRLHRLMILVIVLINHLFSATILCNCILSSLAEIKTNPHIRALCKQIG